MIKEIRMCAFVLLIMTLSCKSRKEQAVAQVTSQDITQTPAPDTTNLSERKNAIMNMPFHRLIVSFTSMGAGISGEGRQKLDEYISTAEKKYKVAIAHVDGHWGREGETDVLFSLQELNENQQKEFINGVKELLKDNKLILIEENKEARTYRQ
jgi:hypothetical protein